MVLDNGAPLLGVVYVPVTGVCYLAVRGQGAWKETGGCNRMPIRVRRSVKLSKGFLVCSFWFLVCGLWFVRREFD